MNRLFICRMRNKKRRFDQGSATKWAEPCHLPSCARTARMGQHQAGTQRCTKNTVFHIGTKFVKGIFPSKRAKWLTKKRKPNRQTGSCLRLQTKSHSPPKRENSPSANVRIAEFLDFAIQAKFAYVNKLEFNVPVYIHPVCPYCLDIQTHTS